MGAAGGEAAAKVTEVGWVAVARPAAAVGKETWVTEAGGEAEEAAVVVAG